MSTCQEQNESWVDITGFEGYYQVSNAGRLKSVDRHVYHPLHGHQFIKGRILQHGIDGGKYHFVYLCKSGKPKMYKVHRLVGFAFVPNPDPMNFTDINHNDGDKSNNAAPNLSWTNDSGNQKHAFENGLNKAARGGDHIQSKSVIQVSISGVPIETYLSVMDAERATGVKNQNICKCANGAKGYKTAGGFKWRYAS